MKLNFFNAICLYLLCSFAIQANEATPEYPVKKITFLEVNASINPATFNYLEDNLRKLSSKKNDLTVIKLDTPGGLVSTTKDILTLIGSVDYPVVVWITPEAASATSAGAIIASGAHLLVMSEGTNIGAATPISMGKDIDQKDSRSKAINDLVALVRSLSKARGRNANEFEKMISEAKSLDARTALEKKVIDKIINDQNELITFLGSKEINVLGQKMRLITSSPPEVITITMDPGQQILNIFANPSTAYILFIIGAALIYFELQAPGGFIAGGIGGVCLLLAGIGFQVLPLNLGALGLILLSFILFIMEAYITSFGVLTIGGLASLVFGSLFLFRTENSFIQLEQSLIFSVVIAIGIYVGLIVWFMVKTRIKDKNYFSNAKKEGIISQILETNKYQVKVNGEIWTAIGDENFEIGDKVKVLKQDDEHLFLKIKKIQEK